MTLFSRLSGALFLVALLTTPVAHAKTSADVKAEQPTLEEMLAAPLETLETSGLFEKTTRRIVAELSQHYTHLPLDDNLSKQLLERYLTTLDPSRMYFVRADIDRFKAHESTLDDELSKGKLTAGYTIYNVYQTREKERLAFLSDLLEKGIDKLDYDSGKNILIDRTKADWVADKAALDEIWRNRLISDVISMRLDEVKDDEISTRLKRRYTSQMSRLQQVNDEDAFQVYINALCSLYDPHTTYFTPDKSTSFNIDMSNSLEGIGAVLQSVDGYTQISSLVPGGPASSSKKLQPGDRIVGVGQGDNGDIINIISWRLDEVVKKIRGPKGSKVRLEIMPASATSEHSTNIITLTRDKIRLEAQAAKKTMLDVNSHGEKYKIGVINLPAFYQDFDAYRRGDPNYASSYRDVKKLVAEIKQENADGLVLDLRNNGGGALFSAIQLVSLFVTGGPTVQIRDARGNVRVENDSYPGTLYKGPMIVLVNRFSASASEIFAGAVQDYGRALVVGDQTFGKGTVQTLMSMNYGDIKITESKFYRVSGSSNQLKGIIPDIPLPFAVDKKDIGESALENALPWDHIASADYTPMFNFGPYLDELVSLSDQRVVKEPDFVYANDMMALLKENRAKETLEINQKQRQQLRDELDGKRLAIENKRREAKDEKPLKTLKDLQKIDEDAQDDEADNTLKADAYLKEAGEILGDLIYLMNNKKVAVRQW